MVENKMEQSFYEDSGFVSKDVISRKKRELTLDFDSPKNLKRQRFNPLLSSPDLNLLKLASPELEKMIIQQSNQVTTTPTPMLFSKHPTYDQELFARGFVDELAALHNSDGQSNPANAYCVQPGRGNTKLECDSYRMDPLGEHVSVPVTSSYLSNVPNSCLPLLPIQVKEEPGSSICSSPPMSPIDMETQERIKLERKRQRNRIAASKCRRRKLERISKLEGKVKQLKCENSELTVVANKLRDQVFSLKEELLEHVSSGCNIVGIAHP